MRIEKIEKRIAHHYEDLDEPSELKTVFKEVLIKFLQHHFVDDKEYDSLFCTIHNNFKEGHNCVACNLHESNRRIEQFLLNYKHFTETYCVLTSFILLLYLQAENILLYIGIIELPKDQIKQYFQPFITVKRWANFLKHPKTFLLVHHPFWRYEDNESLVNTTISGEIIDTMFVNRYYGGPNHNEELFEKLLKKKDITVVFPNPVIFIEQFCQAQKKFVDLIQQNKTYRDLLENKATIHDFYNHLEDNYSQTE